MTTTIITIFILFLCSDLQTAPLFSDIYVMTISDKENCSGNFCATGQIRSSKNNTQLFIIVILIIFWEKYKTT